MKNKIFLLICAVAVLIASVSLLSSCDTDTPGETGSDTSFESNVGGAVPPPDDDPIHGASEIDEYFSGMSEIDKTDRTVTVISESFLEDYWNKAGDEPRALSVREINYIIEDSIRIYREYETIHLAPFPNGDNTTVDIEDTFDSTSAFHPIKSDDSRPVLYGQTIVKSQNADYHTVCRLIHDIITYRIKALSSPDAFVKGTGTEWRNSTVYIPDYSGEADRSALIEYLSDSDEDKIPPLEFFTLSPWGFDIIEFYDAEGGKKLFPSDSFTGDILVLMSDNEMMITLDTLSQTFDMTVSNLSSFIQSGTYTYDENGALILYTDAYRYVFTRLENGDFEYVRYASEPSEIVKNIEDKTVFSFADDSMVLEDVLIDGLPYGYRVETTPPPGEYRLTDDDTAALDHLLATSYNWDYSSWQGECSHDYVFKDLYGRTIRLCSCGRLFDVLRSRQLTDTEWSELMRVLKKYAPMPVFSSDNDINIYY